MWSSAYCFEVKVHEMLAELYPIKISVIFSFPAYSHGLHPMKLKLDL